jgi:hypothetical protein
MANRKPVTFSAERLARRGSPARLIAFANDGYSKTDGHLLDPPIRAALIGRLTYTIEGKADVPRNVSTDAFSSVHGLDRWPRVYPRLSQRRHRLIESSLVS